MKLIIDIDEAEYKTLSKMSEKEKVNELSYYERIIANGTPISAEGDLISRSELKKAFEHLSSDDYENPLWYESTVFRVIDNAPTVEITETEIQEVLNKRCMTAVTNEYLIALHGTRPQGEWKRHDEWRNGEYIGGFYHRC